MLYEFAVLSIMGGDDCNGRGCLLAYGTTTEYSKIVAMRGYWGQFGGYVIEAPAIDDDCETGE